MGFHYENNLTHQQNAINDILSVFDNAQVSCNQNKQYNPEIKINQNNIAFVQNKNKIKQTATNSNILDICMETGTGKTYTYTKLMFELNRKLDIKKFIIIVPSLAIKAGTIAFLSNADTKEHFRDEYHQEIKLFVVESKKNKKQKNVHLSSLKEFVENNDNHISVLLINSGMINSDTMSNEDYEQTLFNSGIFGTPFNIVAEIKPLIIIDEPHKFAADNKTWKNIQNFQAQYIFRFGATFNEQYENLIHQLTSKQAFNQNLIKGVEVSVGEFKEAENIQITLTEIKSNAATFEKNKNGNKTQHILSKNDDLSLIDENLNGIFIENLGVRVGVLLSNGNVLKVGSKINPYCYCNEVTLNLMQQAIKKHFELERKFLNREIKIKPLSLFFIDDINSYRNENDDNAYLKKEFERILKHYLEKELQQAQGFYREYLQKSLQDISATHGGYFSKDNSDNDEKIATEIEEILHDKEKLLSLDNTRRFIFSKWTLKEGWDNPNIFTICKLRSSGSITNKLQEVGRGLRLPVNELMNRITDEIFYLNYLVDFTEKDFAESLVREIDLLDGIDENDTKLSQYLIEKICSTYEIDEEELLTQLDDKGIINRKNEFKENGFKRLKELYPKVFGVGDKIKNANDKIKRTSRMKVEKYNLLKSLWEKINQKMLLEYKINNEDDFIKIFGKFLNQIKEQFDLSGIETVTKRIAIKDGKTFTVNVQNPENKIEPIVTMTYNEFVKKLGAELYVSLKTLHQIFCEFEKNNIFNQKVFEPKYYLYH